MTNVDIENVKIITDHNLVISGPDIHIIQPRKILIMGLPGSGKTWLGERLSRALNKPYWDADVVRGIYNDWDFTLNGRMRQAKRMCRLADMDLLSFSGFICPTEKTRQQFNPHHIIWMDTIKEGRHKDTNKIFEPPDDYDVRFTKWIDENQLHKCLEDFNLGMGDIPNYSNALMQKLGKLQ